jgi:hypothetical protein
VLKGLFGLSEFCSTIPAAMLTQCSAASAATAVAKSPDRLGGACEGAVDSRFLVHGEFGKQHYPRACAVRRRCHFGDPREVRGLVTPGTNLCQRDLHAHPLE